MTDSQPVCLGIRHPSGTRDQFFFLLEISFRQLRLWYLVAPSLTRGRVCNLLYNCFWALPEQSLLGRSPAELTTIFYCLIWDSPNLEGQVPVFISSRNKVAQLYPRALGSLSVASYDLQGYGGGILTRLHTCLPQKFKFKLYCDRQSVLPLLEQVTRCYISLSDNTFIIFHVGHPLWREDGSVICSAMTQVQFQVILRPTVCQPVHLGAGDQILISLFDNFFFSV
jgi:hypothetical protein